MNCMSDMLYLAKYLFFRNLIECLILPRHPPPPPSFQFGQHPNFYTFTILYFITLPLVKYCNCIVREMFVIFLEMHLSTEISSDSCKSFPPRATGGCRDAGMQFHSGDCNVQIVRKPTAATKPDVAAYLLD